MAEGDAMNSDQQKRGRTSHDSPKDTYRAVLKDIVFPEAWVFLALIAGLPSAIYISVLIHIYVTPLFGGELADTIASKPSWGYALNTLVMGTIAIAAVGKYVRERR